MKDNNNQASPMLQTCFSADREKDILKLCEAVLATSLIFWDNPHGGYEYSCPFCRKMEDGPPDYFPISELTHDLDCAYLIAKDLTTGLI